MYTGSRNNVLANTAVIVQRYRDGVGIHALMAEYHCAYPTLMKAMQLLSDEEWNSIRNNHIAMGGIKNRFKPGVRTYVTPKGIRYSPRTEFKKGNVPHNGKQLGTIVIRQDEGKQYRLIATPGRSPVCHKWIPYAVYVLQQNNIEIPKGCFPIHEDGDTLNDSLENLHIVSRSENLALMKERNPGWKKKAIRSLKKTVRRRQKIKALKEKILQKQFIKKVREEQAEQHDEERDRRLLESGIKELQGSMISWWSCEDCGQDYNEQVNSCSKCGSCRVVLIEQKRQAS